MHDIHCNKIDESRAIKIPEKMDPAQLSSDWDP